MAYTFDLVPKDGDLHLTDDAFRYVRWHLLESQPATKVKLMSDPPRIRVRAQGRGWAEVAPAVLARVEALAGVRLDQVLVRNW